MYVPSTARGVVDTANGNINAQTETRSDNSTQSSPEANSSTTVSDDFPETIPAIAGRLFPPA